MAAAANVLNSFELLESILLQTDTYEICIATAVCTSWRAVIENSRALRTHLISLPVRRITWERAAFNAHGQLNSSTKSIWHFHAKTADNGSLFIICFPNEDVEIFLLAPQRKDSYLKVLDDAYDMYAVMTDFKPDLEFWTKTGQKVCRTKCKAARISRPRPKASTVELGYPYAGVICGEYLWSYLSTFYADGYGPGVRLR